MTAGSEITRQGTRTLRESSAQAPAVWWRRVFPSAMRQPTDVGNGRTVNAAVAARCQHVQALEDAIKWRRARAAEPCADCGAVPGGRCEDHARDFGLITDYERTARHFLQAAPYPPGAGTRATAVRDLLAERHPLAALAVPARLSPFARHQRHRRRAQQ